MRNKLRKFNGQINRLGAVFGGYRFRRRHGGRVPAALLLNLRDQDGLSLGGHVWQFSQLKWFEVLGLRVGDPITITAMIGEYRKRCGDGRRAKVCYGLGRIHELSSADGSRSIRMSVPQLEALDSDPGDDSRSEVPGVGSSLLEGVVDSS